MNYGGLVRYEIRLSVISLGGDDAMQIFKPAGVYRVKDWLLHINKLDGGQQMLYTLRSSCLK